jgi:hypothetical protein
LNAAADLLLRGWQHLNAWDVSDIVRAGGC